MNPTPEPTRRILPPAEGAARLGIPVPELVAMIRRHRYKFTALKSDGKPGDRGRNRWGLTEEQFSAILRGQARQFREPEPAEAATTFEPSSPDGRSRLRRPKHTTQRKPTC